MSNLSMLAPEDILIFVGQDDSNDHPQGRGWQGWAIQQIHVLPKRGDGVSGFDNMRGQLSHAIKGAFERPETGWHVIEGARATSQRGAGEKPQIRFAGIRPASPLDVAMINPLAARDLASDMQAEIDRLRALAMPYDAPHLVADGMRDGRVAKPSWQDIEALYPDEVAEAKAQGIEAAADKLEQLSQTDDDGMDLWSAAQIIREMSPKGWPALGIRARPLDWERQGQVDAATQDSLCVVTTSDTTGLTYQVFHNRRERLYEVPVIGRQRYASEDDAIKAAEDHHQSRLLMALERDVHGGERTALQWLLLSLKNGKQKEAVDAMAADLTDGLKNYMGVDMSERGGLMAPLTLSALQTALTEILAQGELPQFSGTEKK